MQDSNDWNNKIERALVENHDVNAVLNQFVIFEWNNFIKALTEESTNFSIPSFSFDSQIVYFTTIFSSLNSSSHLLISEAIELLIAPLAEEIHLNPIMERNTNNAFYIAYATPIRINNAYLLESIALNKKSIGFELRTKAARIIASQDNAPNIVWWQELMKTDDETTLAPMAIDALANKSTALAVKFLGDLREPSINKIDNFRIVIRRLLQKILANGDSHHFSLTDFPYWSRDYIIKLVERSDFQQLDNEWIRDNKNCIEHFFSKHVTRKTGLPPRNLTSTIEDDTVANEISQSLSAKEIFKVFIVGYKQEEKNELGAGLTSRSASIGHRYLQGTNKNELDPILFIGSHVKNIYQLFCSIGDNLDDELIKSSCEYDNGEVISASLHKIYEREQKKILLIIDDFNEKSLEDQKKIGHFLVSIQEICKVVLTMKNSGDDSLLNKEVIQDDENLNEALIYNSKWIHLAPLTKEEVKKQYDYTLTLKREQIDLPPLTLEEMTRQILDREQKVEFLTKCYLGNPLAISLALATGLDSMNCPLPENDKDPVWYSFLQSIELLDDLSKKLLISISIFHNSKIFHNPSLSQQALKYIPLIKDNETQINEAITKLAKLELISLNDELEDLPRIAVSNSICDCIFRMREIQDINFEINENTIFNGLTEYYSIFVENYGGPDWNNKSDFEKIEAEWYNILATLEWNKEKSNFDYVEKIWIKVNRFSDLYGHWGDRKKWLKILIDYYEHGNNLSNTYAHCLSSMGWTLTMSGENFYQEAKEVLEKAWKLKNIELRVSCNLAHNMTVLYYRLRQNDKAKTKIREQLKLYEDIECKFKENKIANCTKSDLQRHLINCIRDDAKIKFLERNWTDAYSQYLDCLGRCTRIGWARMTSYCHYMLAETLLEQFADTPDSDLNQEKSQEILSHISEGVKIAKENSNRRRLAYFKKSYANLQKQMGNLQGSDHWNQEAKNDFERLVTGIDC